MPWGTCTRCGDVRNVHPLTARSQTGRTIRTSVRCLLCRNAARATLTAAGYTQIRVPDPPRT